MHFPECRFLPSFARLPIASRMLLVEVFKADFNFGQFMQLESAAGSLLQLTALAQKRSITYIDPKTGIRYGAADHRGDGNAQVE